MLSTNTGMEGGSKCAVASDHVRPEMIDNNIISWLAELLIEELHTLINLSRSWPPVCINYTSKSVK